MAPYSEGAGPVGAGPNACTLHSKRRPYFNHSSPAAALADIGIYTRSDRPHRLHCPKCEGKEKTLSVDPERGLYHCFRCGWAGRVGGRENWLDAQLEQIREAERKRAQERAQAATRAHALWAESKPCLWHPYLTRKRILPCGARLSGARLVVPMYAPGGELRNAQTINSDGRKLFQRGGEVSGLYFPIGEAAGPIYICEGFATGATLHLYFYPHARVAVAFNAGNLKAVALTLRQKHPSAELVVAADNDAWTAGNPGLSKGREAAATAGARFIYPVFDGLDTSTKPTDFNDLFCLRRGAK